MRRRTEIALLLAIGLFTLGGCVVVQPPSIEMNTTIIHEGHALLFIAVPEDLPNNDRFAFELQIGDMAPVHLRSRALNRLEIPSGWHSFVLNKLKQPETNSSVRHNFEAGTIYRYALFANKPAIEAPAESYSVSPITRDGFEDLVRDMNLREISIRMK